MGAVVFSIDAELGWGFADEPEPPASRVAAAPDGWRALLDVFATHDVPATWAVVAHLFLRECGERCVDYPGTTDAPACDPGAGPDRRLGPELVEAVRSAPVNHELGCHSYSHVRFDRVSRAVARAELERSVATAKEAGVTFDSFVFPRNGVAHRDLLPEYGFRAYRSDGGTPVALAPRAVGKALTTSGLRQVPLVTPVVDEYGLVDVPPSLYLFGFEGWPRRLVASVWDDPVVRLAKRGIDRASRGDGVCHLWLHPNNLKSGRDRRRIRRIVAYAAAQRDRTGLAIETMADVADRVLDQEPVPTATEPTD